MNCIYEPRIEVRGATVYLLYLDPRQFQELKQRGCGCLNCSYYKARINMKKKRPGDYKYKPWDLFMTRGEIDDMMKSLDEDDRTPQD